MTGFCYQWKFNSQWLLVNGSSIAFDSLFVGENSIVNSWFEMKIKTANDWFSLKIQLPMKNSIVKY